MRVHAFLIALVVLVVLGSACGAGEPTELARTEPDSAATSAAPTTVHTPTSTTAADVAASSNSSTTTVVPPVTSLIETGEDVVFDDDSYFIDFSTGSETCRGLADLTIPNRSDLSIEDQRNAAIALVGEIAPGAAERLDWLTSEASADSDRTELQTALHTIEDVTFEACGFPILHAGEGLSVAKFCSVSSTIDGGDETEDQFVDEDCARQAEATRLPCFAPIKGEPAQWFDSLYVAVACGTDTRISFTVDGWKEARAASDKFQEQADTISGD